MTIAFDVFPQVLVNRSSSSFSNSTASFASALVPPNRASTGRGGIDGEERKGLGAGCPHSTIPPDVRLDLEAHGSDSESCRSARIPLMAKSMFLSATTKARPFMASSAQDPRGEQDAQVGLAFFPLFQPRVKIAGDDVSRSRRVLCK